MSDVEDNKPVLYAGKYQSVEELENGYRESTKTVQQLLSQKQALEAEQLSLSKQYQTPDDYVVKEDVVIDTMDALKQEAKALGLTQAQFEKRLQNECEREAQRQQAQALLKAAAGSDDKLERVKRHLQDEMGERLSAAILNNMTPEDFHRCAERLEKSVSSARAFGGGYFEQPKQSDHEKLQALYQQEMQNPNDPKIKADIIALCRRQANNKRQQEVSHLQNEMNALRDQLNHKNLSQTKVNQSDLSN